MKIIGYGRVSTQDQDLSIQKTALEDAGCDIILEEKISGRTREREQLDLALKLLGKEDVLVVTRLDRLGRSMRDLANITHDIDQAGASLRVLEQSVDTSTSAGRAFFGMLATFAQFENDVRKERQMEGIAKAKAEGKYRGRPESIDRDEIHRLKSEGHGPSAIAKDMNIGRASVYRILRESMEQAA